MQKNLDQLVDEAERIGVIGSPSSTSEMALDILAGAVNKKLVGELALFRYHQDGLSHYALGQITEVKLRNVWHEDPTMRSLIRQRGRVDAVSERQDTHLGEMTISAVFSAGSNGYRPSILGTVPATGTPIHLVNDAVLSELLSPYRDQLFYLGHVYGSKPLLPLWFKHFDTGPQGAGEAYHLGIFGKTGSGKSVLAKMILLAYARYPKMALLVIDPQGEFAKEARGEEVPGEFRLPMKDVLERLKKPVQVHGVRDLVLDRWELFAQILYESPFFEQLSIPKGENRQLAASTLADRLQRAKVTLKDLHTHESFDRAWMLLGDENVQKVFYRTEGSRARFQSMYDQADRNFFFTNYWLPVTQLFREDRQGAQKVERLLAALFNPDQAQRPLVVIDLSAEQATQTTGSLNTLPLFGGDQLQSPRPPLFWNEMIQALVIKRLLEGIRTAAEYAYKQNRSLNTLVLMDEAHRLAPREDPDSEEKKAVRGILIDAARTTRKYGVGWLFISQTLSSLHREILEQLRIFFFGFGLGMGAEFKALSELVGGRSKALDLYQLFRDPHSSFDIASREYSFMTIGPVSPLSFAGTPLFFNAFNTVKEFLDTNKLG
ncbi:MAG TPA: ATP-binding protein [Synechococcales cyanobacterium M55_K2018_004]|nr:ATP-binding protein [Synechococcales cyanobacterium M55_K2018_004]